MKVAFTGHRDKIGSVEEVQGILDSIKDSITLLNGNAKGFDHFILQHFQSKYHTLLFSPNYERYGRVAPLVRDRLMVDNCDMLIALWDKRESGGTWYTIKYAERKDKPIIFLKTILPVEGKKWNEFTFPTYR